MDYILAPSLTKGGILSTTFCTASCAHCLFVCSPQREKTYLNPVLALQALQVIKRLGVKSVFIGGGEPFVSLNGLVELSQAANAAGVILEYVETNAFWCADEKKAQKAAEILAAANIRHLRVSISPFHVEFVPVKNIKTLVGLCKRFGIKLEAWNDTFLPKLMEFDNEKVVSLLDYSRHFGRKTKNDILADYPIVSRGRAAGLGWKARKALHSVLVENDYPCEELYDKENFYIDVCTRFVPGGCSGLSMDIADIDKSLDPATYPVLFLLAVYGIRGLYEWAEKQFGFVGPETVSDKCELCQKIRKYLSQKEDYIWQDLSPAEFYRDLV